MVDVIAATRDIVLPALEAVFRQGEVEDLRLRERDGSLHISLTAVGESFEDEVVQASAPGESADDWRERLRSNFVDFVAESRFGWGQNRDRGP